MNFVKNSVSTFKRTIIFILACLVVALVTSYSVNAQNASNPGELEVPPQRLVGYAWSENIGWISFNDGSKPVVIEADGGLNGFAWSEHIGWIKFGGWASVPDLTRGINARLQGSSLTGWARAVSGMTKTEIDAISPTLSSEVGSADVRGGWDGWLSLQGITLSNATTGVPPVKKFQGYAWGSDILGWVTFDSVGITSNLNSCIGPYGTVIADGQNFTYYTEQAADGTCSSEERSCKDGALTGSYTEISCGDESGIKKQLLCTRAGSVLKQGEKIDLYTKSSVRAGASCQPLKDTLTCKNGKFIGSDGMQDTEHMYANCRPLPGYKEF